MDHTILLRVVTPSRQVVREDVEEIQAPGREGYLGILPGHAPLLSALKAGEFTYRTMEFPLLHTEHLDIY